MYSEVQGYLTGAFPHSEELIRANMDYGRGRICSEDLALAFEADRKRVIAAQKKAGFKFISDGMLTWGDLLRPFTKRLTGVEAGSLKRWFNNNTFYWAPRIIGEIERTEKILVPFTSAKDYVNKLIVPGPYTFSRLAENRYYKSIIDLMLDFAEALNSELRGLDSRFSYIQLNEPSLVYQGKIVNDEARNITEAIRVAVKNVRRETCLHTYFGSIENACSWILDLPVESIGIDFCETQVEDIEAIDFTKDLACGIVDARSSFIEDPQQIAKITNHIIDKLGPKKVFICPNTDLAFRPENIARKKIAAIGKAIRILRE